MLKEILAGVAGMLLAVHVVPGVRAASLEWAVYAGLVLAVINLILRPFTKIFSKPLGCLTFGLLGTVIDAGLVLLCVRLMDGMFTVQSFFPGALLTALIVNALRLLIGRSAK